MRLHHALFPCTNVSLAVRGLKRRCFCPFPLRAVEWIKTLEKPSVWDQNAFNDISRRGSGRSDAKGVFPAFGGKLKMGVLPVTLFASGQVFYVQVCGVSGVECMYVLCVLPRCVV